MATYFQTTLNGGTWMPGYVFRQALLDVLARQAGLRICDVGGGANPALSLAEIADSEAEYVVSDVSAEELAKAPDGYHKQVIDVMQPGPGLEGAFDVVASKTVMEHIPDPLSFHTNIRRMLTPGGVAVHMFPTLYAVPFMANLLLPEAIGGPLLRVLRQGRENEGNHGKFRPYYRWCRGPSARQVERLESPGYIVQDYFAFFGHRYYRRVPPLDKAEHAVSRMLARHPVPALTSFAVIVLRKT
jgi:SAM-dependent methyltransferase